MNDVSHYVLTELHRKRAEWAAAVAEREQARQWAGRGADDDRLAGLDHAAIAALADHAQNAVKCRAEAEAVRALEDWLGNLEVPTDLPQREQGLEYLRQWLRGPERGQAAGPGALRSWMILAGALVSAAGIFLVGYYNAPKVFPALMVGLALVAVLLMGMAGLILFNQGRETARQRTALAMARQKAADAFLRLNLGVPRSWSMDAVQVLHDQLSQRLMEGRVTREKAQRWASLADRRSKVTHGAIDLASEATALRARLGVAPDADPAAMYLLAVNLVRWQQAHLRVIALTAAIAELQSAVNEVPAVLAD